MNKDVKKEVLVNIGATGEPKLMVGDNAFMVEGLTFRAEGISSPYTLYFGNSKYKLDGINFYGSDGVVYCNNCGWFEGAGPKRFRWLWLDTKQDQPKRVKIDDKFSYKNAYTQELIFFVSLGKDYNGTNRAVLYIPMTYLESIGYQVVKTTTTEEYITRIKTYLITSEFLVCLDCECIKHIENIKTDMKNDLEQCNTSEDLDKFLKRWYVKI